MEIYITEDIRIRADTYNIITEEKVVRQKRGDEETYEDWDALWYTGTLESALTYLIDRVVTKSEAKSFKKLREDILKAKEEIVSACSEVQVRSEPSV